MYMQAGITAKDKSFSKNINSRLFIAFLVNFCMFWELFRQAKKYIIRSATVFVIFPITFSFRF